MAVVVTAQNGRYPQSFFAHLYTSSAPTVDVQAAARGLAEELGIDCDPCALQGPMTPNHARKLEVPGKFCDSEFVECYRHALPFLIYT